MPVQTGTRLGPYEIISALGAGGMGEVYRARDTRLDRTVAIKVLPPHLADDQTFRERFDREARAISSLNHPHICTLYDVGHHEGTDFLVMEFLDGESLADRIGKGAVPLPQALTIAIEIAEALDTAHRAGIVHRDLKPGNVMLTKAGAKLLDFGLAKPATPAVAMGGASMLPTTPANLTAQGTILGTFQYMAPEQIEGQEADARTDIFAFGALVYELLTGKKAFQGKSHASLVGAIMHSEPAPVSAVLPLSPPALDRVVKKCLAKDPDDRWQTARDLLDELRWIARGPSADAAAASVATKTTTSLARIMVPTAVALLAATMGAGVAWVARAPAGPETITFTVDTPNTGEPAAMALSPDGRQLAFVAADKDGQQKLWIRSLASATARAMSGTEQASTPFWSPDSRKIAFFGQGVLKRIDVAGGAPQLIAKTATTTAMGGSWNDRDVILFARAGAGTGILRVDAAGGEPQRVTTPGGDENHGWPAFLPDGRHFIYLSSVAAWGIGELRWRDLDSNVEHAVRKVASKAFYSLTGHLLFRLDGPIVAQPFDGSRGKISGDAIQVAGNTWYGGYGRAAFALSPKGVLAHRGGEEGGAVAQLSWVDRQGKLLIQVGPAGDYRNPVVDAAGEHVAANVNKAGEEDVWVFDVKRGTTSRLTFDPAIDSDPVFSPDGRSVAFYSTRNPPGIYRKATNGAGADALVAQTGFQTWPRDWSSDGRFLLYMKVADLWVVPMDGDRKPFPYLATPAREIDGHFSPDSHWVAYGSDETGRSEVFVQDFPAKGAKFQVSTAGGSEPRWRRDGRELFYLGGDGWLMSVNVDTKPEFKLDVPKPVFQTRLMNLPLGPQRRYGVSADGQRFLMNIPTGGETLSPITVIVNWQSVLKGK